MQQYWGYDKFRPRQQAIIESVLQGRDTVALLPTGGGKSLCFQLPTLAEEGICVVISPLVALMNDQVNDLKSKGIKAMALTGGIPFSELSTLLDNANYGNYKFLYLSPERLQQEIVQNGIKRMNVNLIAVDEAHCISQWGNDFRPAYQNIHLLKELHPEVPTIALTATATPRVLEDTIEQLRLQDVQIFKNSFVRENLSYEVFQENDKLYRIEQLLKGNMGSAIVYVRSRRSAEEVSDHLNQLGISSTFFHGGITSEEKKERLQAWKSEQISTVVATNAFGMGIDHATVRFVIHIQLPESLESYFQEAGRAGRDGKPARAIIVYNADDKRLVKKQFIDALPTVKDIKRLYRTLCTYFQIPYGEGEFTKHNFNFNDFCDTYSLNTMVTYNGLQTLDRLGIIELSREFGRKSILTFLLPSAALLKEFEKNSAFSLVGKTILRMYGGVFETPNAINLSIVSKKMGLGEDRILEVLLEMQRQQLIELKHFPTDASITFLVPREDDRTINPFGREIEAQIEKNKMQVASVLHYVEDASECKQLHLVRYFGEENSEPCGVCSYCTTHSNSDTNSSVGVISEKILELLKEDPLESRSIIEKLNFAEKDILNVLQLLLDSGAIKLNVVNQYFVK